MNFLRCTDNFKCLIFQINHVIRNINPADRIDNIMLILKIYKLFFCQFLVHKEQGKPCNKIECHSICNDHTTLRQNFVFPKKYINIILTVFRIAAIKYLTVFFYTDQCVCFLLFIKYHNAGTVLNPFALHRLIV